MVAALLHEPGRRNIVRSSERHQNKILATASEKNARMCGNAAYNGAPKIEPNDSAAAKAETNEPTARTPERTASAVHSGRANIAPSAAATAATDLRGCGGPARLDPQSR